MQQDLRVSIWAAKKKREMEREGTVVEADDKAKVVRDRDGGRMWGKKHDDKMERLMGLRVEELRKEKLDSYELKVMCHTKGSRLHG